MSAAEDPSEWDDYELGEHLRQLRKPDEHKSEPPKADKPEAKQRRVLERFVSEDEMRSAFGRLDVVNLASEELQAAWGKVLPGVPYRVSIEHDRLAAGVRIRVIELLRIERRVSYPIASLRHDAEEITSAERASMERDWAMVYPGVEYRVQTHNDPDAGCYTITLIERCDQQTTYASTAVAAPTILKWALRDALNGGEWDGR